MAGSGVIQKTKGPGSDKFEENDIMKEIPPRLGSCLMSFQREGVLFAVRKGGRCLIADEMGLGKTLQALAVACYFQSEWPVLIIVPSSLRYVWIEELEKWLPDILPHEINLIQGGFDTGGIADAKITIVTYGLLSCSSSGMVKEALKARQFQVAICDESHFFKNSQTQCCKAVSPLLTSATRCILLSGTPALAKPAELFTQLDALLPGKFGSFWSFTKKYCAGHWQHFGRRRHWKADGASNLDDLQQRLKSVMIRREKSSVLTQLPPKQRQKILFALKDSQTKKEILSCFEELKPMLKRSKSTLAASLLGGEGHVVPEGADCSQTPDTNILSHIQRLYRLTGEAKIGPAREYVQMLCENANLKFLVFAYHHAMMDGLQQTLYDKKIQFVRIDGNTKPSDRQLYVQRFQSDKDTRVAILSILAAGVGLTLTAASLVVFAELYWTPGVMVQCEDRAHRIGQSSTVPVHYLVARDTMDEWVWSAVCRKTIVMSKALMGKSHALKADAGERYQVDLLSAADAYTPVDDSGVDVSQLFLSQRASDQKSILDFFGSQHDPSQSNQTSTKSSTSCSSSQDTEEPMNGKGIAPATPSAASSKSRKKLFPLLTSLKKPSQSSSECDLSQEPLFIDSSDDELNSSCQNSPRLLEVQTRAEEDRTDWKTQNQSQTKTGSSRKRKCAVKGAESNSDSEFVESPSGVSHSAKKRKCRTKSVPSLLKSCSKSGGKKKGQGELKMSSRQNTKTVNGDKWACSSCTFSNNSLLPFCEICETPRKEKGEAGEQKTDIPGKPSDTAKTPSHASLKEDFELSSPVCSSTHICKQKTGENLVQRTGRVVPSCEADVEEAPLFKSTSRCGAKRNLTFGVGESQTGVDSVDDKTAQSDDKNSLRPSLENSDAFCSPKAVSEPNQGVTEAACRNGEDMELVTFQLNSSMDEDNGYISPCLFESEEEEEQKTLVVSGEGEEHIASFSSPASTHSCNTTGDLSVTEPVCSDYGSSQKSKSADLFTTDNIPSNTSSGVNSNGTTTEKKRIEPDIGEIEKSDLPEIKPPKRKSFMLGTPNEKQCTEMSPKNNTTSVADSFRNASDGTGETCVENLTDHDTNLTSNEKHTDFTVVKGKPVVGKPNGSETSQTIMAVKKSNGSEARQTLWDEAGERTEKSTAVGEGSPQCDETSLSSQTCGGTEDRTAAAEDRGPVQGEGQREVSLCDGVDTVTSAAQPDQQQGSGDDVHSSFMFCCSSYTGRVYLFDKHGVPLKANFLPLEVELDNGGELPPILHHPQHLRLAQHFVRQWTSLTDTKRRLIMKRGLKFHNPLAAYDLVRTDLSNNKQRYQTKEDQTKVALKRAMEVKGKVRVLSKHGAPVQMCVADQDSERPEEGEGSAGIDPSHCRPQGYVQAMTADGTPLCVHCQQPCTSLVSHKTLSDSNSTAWNTRFCSRVCADAHWMKTNTGYLRSSVYDVQHGVCQLCGLDAHTFFCQIRDSVDRKLRAEKITNSKFCKLGNSLKKQMVARPYEGLFWQVDHIRPVWEGGGQCDVDNLRTLCAPCHSSLTAKQATKRAHARKLSKAACAGDISAFFKKM